MRKLKLYQINAKLMKLAKKDSMPLHALPVKGVTSEIVDESQSVVFSKVVCCFCRRS